jgi:O-antigen/teichoic acid export membrane protein
MRMATNLAALVALACVGFALGDWASHPNAIGMLGICLLVVVFGVLLSYLYGLGATKLKRPPPPPPPPSTPSPRRRPSLSAPPAGWDGGDDADRLWSDR